MDRQRNNIYAVAADAVDLALDTAGTIGSMVGGMASMIGIGGSGKAKSEAQSREEADDAANRMATTVRQEMEAVKPRLHKAKARVKAKTLSSSVAKRRPAKSVKKVAKRRAA